MLKNSSNITHFSPTKRDSFFGRRHGPSLRERQSNLLKNLLPLLKIDIREPYLQNFSNFLHNFEKKKIILEIGFGGGEHLFHALKQSKDSYFLAIEPFVNSMAKFLCLIEDAPHLQERIRLFDDDAALLLDWLPDSCVDKIDLFYPDPWPKKKHWKRRFIQPKNLDRFARVLKPKAKLRFASDIPHYVNWTIFYVKNHKDFQWICENPRDWEIPFDDWVTTRYEQKALLNSRVPCYLTFERL